MENRSEAIYLLDLSRCEPHEALSNDSRPGAWSMVDYEIERFLYFRWMGTRWAGSSHCRPMDKM